MRRRDFLQKGTITAAGLALYSSGVAAESSNAGEKKLPAEPRGENGANSIAESPNEFFSCPASTNCDRELLPKLPVSLESFVPATQKISPMDLEERIRRNLVPERGFCSIAPGKDIHEGLFSGNGKMFVEFTSQPVSEEILFHQEQLMAPWERPLEAPKVAFILPKVRELLLQGKYREGLNLAYQTMENAGTPMNMEFHRTIPAFRMRIDADDRGPVSGYLRTLDFESGEVRARWRDGRGEWVRDTFVSRPDDVVVQLMTAPPGHSVNATVAIESPRVDQSAPGGPVIFDQKLDAQRLILTGRFDPHVSNNGYAAVIRVIPTGGSATIQQGKLVIANVKSVLLLTRIDWLENFTPEAVASVVAAVDGIDPNYASLLERQRTMQSPIANRVSVDFGGSRQRGMAAEELIVAQRTVPGYAPALLEKMFDMGRYWLMASSGRYPPMVGEVNINVNLQISGGVMGNLPEAMDAYFNWIESLRSDCQTNARNIFGARGMVYPIIPQKGMGVSFYYASWTGGGGGGGEGPGIWPHIYWISAGGWLYSPFWDHYLVTGDLQFLRDRVMPGLKELALFYEDFLTVTDKEGNYVFLPSFSPENMPTNEETSPSFAWPGPNTFNVVPPTPLLINASMDLGVCHEVLTHLIEASEILGMETENVPKWKAMLKKMPPYLTQTDGALKEWSWPTIHEHENHRHVSHLYGAWPSDEINPSSAPQLARAALLADRKRGPGDSSAHGLCHRALAGARLKDSYLVNFELKQLLEQGYVGPTLRTLHFPYYLPFPDVQGAFPTIMMEMLVASRPGVIELLPALPVTLDKGAIRGMLARTFVKVDKLTWNIPAREEIVTLTSVRKQDITLVVWHGIETITASPGVLVETPRHGATTCMIHLPKNEPVTLHIRIHSRDPLNWAVDARTV